jgi:hypothetical protein
MSEQAAVPAAGRYKLKSYVYFGETEDGVWFEAGDKSFVLKDRKLYPLVERFVDLVDSGTPVEEIVARAPAKLQGFFPKLLDSLVRHDMLLALDDDYAFPAALTEHTGAAELLKVLEDRLQGAALVSAVRRWQEAHVVIAGSGYALKAAACALAAAGCQALRVQWQGGAGRATFAEVEAAVRSAAVEGAVLCFQAGAPDASLLGDSDLLVYASDSADLALARLIDTTLRQNGRAGAIAACFDGHACVLPPVEHGRAGLDELLAWLPPADPAAASHSATSLSVLGCVAAQGALFQFFGFDQDKRRGSVPVVTPELHVVLHSLVPSGGRPLLPFEHAPRFQLPEARALETFELLKLALAPWFDGLLGALSVGADDGIQQMPLLQYPVQVRRPGRETALVVGWGLDLGQAGIRALCDAVALLAAPLAPEGAAVVAAADEGHWQRSAYAAAVVRSEAFRAAHASGWVDLDAVDDPGVGVLRRLIRYHSRAPLQVRLHWSGQGAVFAAEAWLGDTAVSTAVGDTVGGVIAEALGRACSNFQLSAALGDGYWTRRRDPLPPPHGDTPADYFDRTGADGGGGARRADCAFGEGSADGDWRAALALEGAAAPVAATWHRVDALGLPPGVHCGYATLNP